MKSWIQAGRQPPVDKDGVPSLSDYTPPPEWMEELKFWIGVAVVVIAAVITMPILIYLGVSLMNGLTADPFRAGTVSVNHPDTGTIIIVYEGSSGAESLQELNGTVTSASGQVQSKTLGSRSAATSLDTGTFLKFTGDFSGIDHVFVTGYYRGDNYQGDHFVVLLDTNV
jgi:hypothetical protein